MNLSEIRKKAQQERSNGNGAVLPADGGGPEETAAVASAAAPSPENPVNLRTEEMRPALPPKPEAPVICDIDPISLILAGRAALCRDSDAGLAETLQEDAGGSEFQELLCFRVAAERYAVDIMEIREIIKPRAVTEVPRMPAFVDGVLSLRGIIIPVFSMHKRLGHAGPEGSGKERIIVVNRGEEFCGVLVDEVTQVARLDAATIEPPPAVLEGIDRDFVAGIGRIEGQMLILLNLENILDMNLS
jgi:purine-binding chemotaxis protein CheW